MPDLLRSVEYAPSMLGLIRNFDFGDEPYQKELGQWIIDDAEQAMARGTKVWIYVNQADQIVGYGSLGQTNWKYPEPNSNKVTVAIVPAVAIRKEFWGEPKTGDKEEKYSSQIMRELIRQAIEWNASFGAVGLFVHPENLAAIKLYERFGFKRFYRNYEDKQKKVTYLGYVLPLSVQK